MPRRFDPALAGRIEELGYTALWLGSSPSVDDARPFIEASERIPVITGILNIWQHDPADVARDHARIVADHPGRFVLGIGIGHPESTSDWKHPVEGIRTFLDGLDAAGTRCRSSACSRRSAPHARPLRRARTSGRIPTSCRASTPRSPVSALGAEPCSPPRCRSRSRTTSTWVRARASKWATRYFGLVNYTRNLKSFGFEDRDFEDGGSDALLDATVPHGSATRVAAGVQAHLDAGADHVCVQAVSTEDPLPDLEALAAEIGLTR